MNPKNRNRFYLGWTLAIFLCAALALFTVFYASFGHVKTVDNTPALTETTTSVNP